MEIRHTASSQVAWALLTEGVTRARLEAHRLQHLLSRASKLVAGSEQKEHIHQVAGDIIQGVPARLQALETALDRTSLALSKMGDTFLNAELSLDDRGLIDDAVEPAAPVVGKEAVLAQRVAQKWADLNPPLGKPGGPCQVVDRIDRHVNSPALKNELIRDVEGGDPLDNAEASAVYKLEVEAVGGAIRRMALTNHVQYRMDLRGITVALLQRSLLDLSKAVEANLALMRRLYSGSQYTWEDPKRGITVGLIMSDRVTAKILTVYQTGHPDPKPPGSGGCQ